VLYLQINLASILYQVDLLKRYVILFYVYAGLLGLCTKIVTYIFCADELFLDILNTGLRRCYDLNQSVIRTVLYFIVLRIYKG